MSHKPHACVREASNPMGARRTTNPRCDARSKQTGEQCRKYAVAGSRKCRYHGGLTPRGVQSPHYKAGLYAKSLKSLRETIADLDKPELRDELAMARGALMLFLEEFGDVERVVALKGGLGALMAALEQIRRIVDTMTRPQPVLQAVSVTVQDTGLLDMIAELMIERMGEEVAADFYIELRRRARARTRPHRRADELPDEIGDVVGEVLARRERGGQG